MLQLQLSHYYLGAVAVTTTIFGEGSGPILFSNVACNGNEFKLFECAYYAVLGGGSCRHSADAGVICQAGKQQEKEVV